MDLTKKWHRSEFVSHEMLEVHRGIECELDFYSAIANGEIELVQENCNEQAFTNPEGMGVLSTDALRNIRYHYVVTVALITRFCVHEGLEQEKAYNLSDFYILEMDKCKTIEQISKLHDVMCLDFCKHMHEIKNSQVLSKQVVLCLDYIYSHIKERITVAMLAEYTGLSESYLSRVFKQNLGISISDYIREKKIEKATHLLRYSDKSIIDIANYLSFSSQSHFIQTFENFTGMTPKKYRNKYYKSMW